MPEAPRSREESQARKRLIFSVDSLKNKFIDLFIFGCVGSLLLYLRFL